MEDPYRTPSPDARPPLRPQPPPRWVQHRPWSLILLLEYMLALAAAVVVLAFGLKSAVDLADTPTEPEPPRWMELSVFFTFLILGGGLILGAIAAAGIKLTIRARHEADDGNPRGLRAAAILAVVPAGYGAAVSLNVGFPWGAVACGLCALPAVVLLYIAWPIKGWDGQYA